MTAPEFILGKRTPYGAQKGTPEWDAENARRAVLRRAALRRAVLVAYGGPVPRCDCCGEMRDRFLQIDHVGGGGNQRRKDVPATRLYAWLRQQGYPPGYRILCANCNHAFGVSGECAHGVELLLAKRLSPIAQLPTKAHRDDAGYDMFVTAPALVMPGEFVDIPMGIAIGIPFGLWAQVTGRSSTLRRKGLLVIDGVIDTGYTGELFVGAFNLSAGPVEVRAGERLAQLILHSVVYCDTAWADELPETHRGDKGFGSTGQ